MNHQQTYHQQYIRFQKNREKIWASKINNALMVQIKSYIQAENLAVVSFEPVAKVLRSLYYDVASIQGHRTLLSIDKQNKERRPMGFDEFIQQLMSDYFDSEILKTSLDITDTTKDFIKQVLIENNTMAYDDIVKLLLNDNLTPIRARLIARTEVSTAANTASIKVAKNTGLELIKEWLSTIDNRTRGAQPHDKFDHLHLNGTQIGVDDYFYSHGEYLLHPGDKNNGASAGNICNCRCTCLFIPK